MYNLLNKCLGRVAACNIKNEYAKCNHSTIFTSEHIIISTTCKYYAF